MKRRLLLLLLILFGEVELLETIELALKLKKVQEKKLASKEVVATITEIEKKSTRLLQQQALMEETRKAVEAANAELKKREEQLATNTNKLAKLQEETNQKAEELMDWLKNH